MIIEEYNESRTRVTHYSDGGYIIRQVETGNLYGSAEDNVPCEYTYEETSEKPEEKKDVKRCWLSVDGDVVEVGEQPHGFTLPKSDTRRYYSIRDVYEDGWLRVTWRHGTSGWRAIGIRQNTESGISEKQAEKLAEWEITEIALFDSYIEINI